MFAQSLGTSVIFYLRTSISVTSHHIKQDILTSTLRPVTTFLHSHCKWSWMPLSGCWWWALGYCAQEEASVYGRSHSLCGSDSGVRTLSDQSPPLLSSILIILIPGCRVCCVLIPIPAPSQRRVVPRVSEPFTGTITMSPGSRHQHQDHNINIRTSRAVIHPDSAWELSDWSLFAVRPDYVVHFSNPMKVGQWQGELEAGRNCFLYTKLKIHFQPDLCWSKQHRKRRWKNMELFFSFLVPAQPTQTETAEFCVIKPVFPSF